MTALLTDTFTIPETRRAWQQQCLEKFLSIGLPDKKSEAYHYFPSLKFKEYVGHIEASSRVVAEDEFSELIQEKEEDAAILIFQNGKFLQAKGLPSKVVVMTLEEACRSSYASFLEHRQKMLIAEEKDPMALLNGACSSEGLFVYIPPKMRLEIPLKCLFIQTDPLTVHICPRIHILVGKEAQVGLITSFEGGALFNGYLDIALEEQAVLVHTSYSGEIKPDFGFFAVRSTLKRDSLFRSVICNYGSSCQREDYKVLLLGEKAKTELLGLCVLAENGHFHANMQVEHRSPGCFSEQKFKQVLAGHSRSSFTGTIFVDQCAQQTQAYQLSRSLLLSEGAMACAKPNLEIFADDVKASHGATISQIDPEQRLYLQSRGVPFEMAGALLTQGFCDEILDEVPFDGVRAECDQRYKRCLANSV